jgi:AcrR family transcriptional regulator
MASSKSSSPTRAEANDRRRTEILDKAIELFAAHCYAGTDTQMLADELQVGKGTLYRYFQNKEELFLAAVDYLLNKMKAKIDAAADSVTDPLEKVRAGVLAYLTFYVENPDYAEMLIQERALFKDRGTPSYFRHRERHVQRWRDLYRGLIDDGRVRNMTPEQITNVMADLIFGTMCANYFAHRDPVPAEQVEAILDVVWRGILSDSERAKVAAGRA